MTADTITAIKKALEGVTPDRVERLWWFLHIISKSAGSTDATHDKWNWINAFCHDFEDDTFNRAADLGFISVSFDSIMETSTAKMTPAGNAFIAYFDKAPSAPAQNVAVWHASCGDLLCLIDDLTEANGEMFDEQDREKIDAIDKFWRDGYSGEDEVTRLREALEFYANPKNWQDTPPWDGDPDCITPAAIPVDHSQEGSPCDCGDRARAALSSTGDTHGN